MVSGQSIGRVDIVLTVSSPEAPALRAKLTARTQACPFVRTHNCCIAARQGREPTPSHRVHDSYELTSEGDYCTEPPHQLIARAGVTAMLKLTVQACKELRDAGPSGSYGIVLTTSCVSEPHEPPCANRVPKSTATRMRQS